jgi:lipopolysaccharide transport system permease protein
VQRFVRGGIRARPAGDRLKSAPAEQWDVVISASRSSVRVGFRELWQYRDLLLLLVRRDFVSIYRQTVLGPLWFVLQPALTMLVFWFIFGRLAQLSTDGLPPMLFYLVGIMCWTYLSSVLVQTSSSFRDNAALFGKIYFPRLILPLSLAISHLMRFGMQLLLLVVLMAYFAVTGVCVAPTGWVLALPMFLAMIAAQGLGVGLIVSSLTTRYRDLGMLVAGGVQLLMYFTPVAYPLSALSGKLADIMQLNPMTPVIEGTRKALLGQGTIDASGVAYGVVVSLVLLAVGLITFARVERNFVDTV